MCVAVLVDLQMIKKNLNLVDLPISIAGSLENPGGGTITSEPEILCIICVKPLSGACLPSDLSEMSVIPYPMCDIMCNNI